MEHFGNGIGLETQELERGDAAEVISPLTIQKRGGMGYEQKSEEKGDVCAFGKKSWRVGAEHPTGSARAGGEREPPRWGCHLPWDNLHIYFNPPGHE